MRCWCGYCFGAKCRLRQGIATASRNPIVSCLIYIPTGFTFQVPAYPGCPGKEAITHTHTHTHLTALFPGLPGRAGTRKVKPIWILLKQETVSGSGISWGHMQVCTLLQTDNQASTPPVSFLQAGCPSCRPTNDIKALKAQKSPLNGCNSSSSSTSMFYCCCLSYLVSNIMMFTTVPVGMATFTQQCFVSVNITCLG